MSKITTHQTEFERPDLLRAALASMGAVYRENAPIPGAYSAAPVDFAISGESFGRYRGIGYTFDQKAGRLVRKMDDMDLVRVRGEGGGWTYVPRPEIAEFETRLHDHYNLALVMERLAQGCADVQQTALEDGTIILDVTEHAYGG